MPVGGWHVAAWHASTGLAAVRNSTRKAVGAKGSTHAFGALMSSGDKRQQRKNLMHRRCSSLPADGNQLCFLCPACAHMQLIGRRADAVASFRAAYQLVRATEGVPEVPEAVVALRNLNKALKQVRTRAVPPYYAGAR